MSEEVRILIADDNSSSRLVLSRMLSRLPDVAIVGEAESGERACEALASTNPDVVLMDVVMEGMGGVEAARRIAESTPGACVIGVSASDDPSTSHAMRSAGAVAFVPKTASVDQLVYAIHAAVSGRDGSGRRGNG